MHSYVHNVLVYNLELLPVVVGTHTKLILLPEKFICCFK